MLGLASPVALDLDLETHAQPLAYPTDIESPSLPIHVKAHGDRRVTLGVRGLEGPNPVGTVFTGRTRASVERKAASMSRDDARRLADALDEAGEERGRS